MRDPAVQLKKEREIGPELLRIVAMLMIILSHISVHGGLTYPDVCLNGMILSVMAMGGKTGVIIFILISGYFSVHASMRPKKAAILIAQTVFYSLLTYGLACLAGADSFRPKHLFYALLPFFSDKGYWFITIYLLLYVLTPLLNAGLKRLTQRQYLYMLALFLFLGSVLPYTYGYFFKTQSYSLTELPWFAVLYSIGAYLRLYPIRLLRRRALPCLMLFGTAVLAVGARILYVVFGIKFNEPKSFFRMALLFLSNNTVYGPLAILFSVFALIVFLQIKLKPNRPVFAAAGSVFGIYLLHDSEWTREYLWKELVRLPRFGDSPFFIPAVLLILLLIFTVGSLTDILRKNLLEKPLFNSALYKKAENALKLLIDRSSDKLHIRY